MKHITEVLERCRDWHARAANTAEARARQLELQGEAQNAEIQLSRQSGHLAFRDAIHGALRSFKARERAKGFVAPTLEEVQAFSNEHADIKGRWPLEDIKSWFYHFESCGWLVGRGKKMKDWRAAALNGFKRWRDDHPISANAKPKTGDPDGWRKYLVEQRQPYVEFKYAPGHVQSDFKKQAK
jgi:hypothetical protein